MLFSGSLFAAAAELRRQEFARLADAVTPRLEALRSMTPAAFRSEIALMLERLGHTIITDPTAPDLVTTKAGRKYITACAHPANRAPTQTREIARLHDTVVAANAERGFFVTARSFTPDAEHYAATAPIDLVDGAMLVRSMNRSKKGVVLPQTYKAMCRQCGDIVEHRLDGDEAVPCRNGHRVPPTIARAALVPPRQQQPAAADHQAPPQHGPRAKLRNMSPKAQRRRAIRAHNHQVRARAIRQRPDGGR
jgi:hypothetical protein